MEEVALLAERLGALEEAADREQVPVIATGGVVSSSCEGVPGSALRGSGAHCCSLRLIMIESRLAPGTSSTHHVCPLDSRYLQPPTTAGQQSHSCSLFSTWTSDSQVHRDVQGHPDLLALLAVVHRPDRLLLERLDELAGAVSGRNADGHGGQKFV